MGLPSIQIPAPDKIVLYARMLKMILKQIGVLYNMGAQFGSQKSPLQ
jgi:hypothetical protein